LIPVREGAVNLYARAAGGIGGEEQILKLSWEAYPSDWSRDGRFIIYDEGNPKTKGDIWVLPLEGDRKPFPFAQTKFNEFGAVLSPDGRWLAYVSDESGRNEVYIRTFTGKPEVSASAGKWLVSTNGGIFPRWRRDGRELFYLADDGKLMAVEIKSGANFEAGAAKLLFDTPKFGHDVTADGQRFIVLTPVEQAQFRSPITVVLNWQAALKK
jgi:eukaryotic-like serine/threonine-protein kinase